jgi:hypothetical protein
MRAAFSLDVDTKYGSRHMRNSTLTLPMSSTNKVCRPAGNVPPLLFVSGDRGADGSCMEVIHT